MKHNNIMKDDIIDFTNKCRSQFPRMKDTYLPSGVLDIHGIMNDLECINDNIERYLMLRELLTDYSERILMSINEHTRMKKEATEKVNSIGVGKITMVDSQFPSLSSVPIIDYISGTETMPIYTPVSTDVSLPAIHVSDKLSVRSDGNLYYIQPINKFGFRINGHLFCGNIGEVYTNERNPVKIKQCSHGNKCNNMSTCSYYHRDTKDTRNFISGSFIYQKNNPRISSQTGRKIGNKSTLVSDITSVANTDLELYRDQSVHDILCNLVIAERKQ